MENIFESIGFKKIYFNDVTFTKDQVVSSINDLTKYLQVTITSKSPFIYLFAYNHIKTIISYFAIIKAGYIVILIDPEIKRFELDEILINTPPSAFIKIIRATT